MVRAPIDAPAPIVTNGADRHVGAERGIRRDRRSAGRSPACAAPPVRTGATACAKLAVGIVAAKNGASAASRTTGLGVRITAEARVAGEMRDDSADCEEGEIARLGLLEAGHADDVDVAAALRGGSAAVRRDREVSSDGASAGLPSGDLLRPRWTGLAATRRSSTPACRPAPTRRRARRQSRRSTPPAASRASAGPPRRTSRSSRRRRHLCRDGFLVGVQTASTS